MKGNIFGRNGVWWGRKEYYRVWMEKNLVF